jgi:hypothetical protein
MDDIDKPAFEKATDFCEAKFQSAEIVFNFAGNHLDAINSVFPRNEFGFRDSCVKGLWYRAYSWLESLTKLNSPKDYQAFAAANRGLFEITVDLALLYDDKTNSSGWKMWWWNLSEKLVGAEILVAYFNEQSIEIPDVYSEQQEFIKREKDSILHMRSQLWNTVKHPKRWSNNGSLFDELKNVDRILETSILKLFGMSLTQYYRTEYRRMNWYIHSGVSSFWNLPAEAYPTLSAFLLDGCANFGLLSTHIVLKDFGLAEHLPNYYEQLQKLETAKLQTQINYLDKWVSDEIAGQK